MEHAKRRQAESGADTDEVAKPSSSVLVWKLEILALAAQWRTVMSSKSGNTSLTKGASTGQTWNRFYHNKCEKLNTQVSARMDEQNQPMFKIIWTSRTKPSGFWTPKNLLRAHASSIHTKYQLARSHALPNGAAPLMINTSHLSRIRRVRAKLCPNNQSKAQQWMNHGLVTFLPVEATSSTRMARSNQSIWALIELVKPREN